MPDTSTSTIQVGVQRSVNVIHHFDTKKVTNCSINSTDAFDNTLMKSTLHDLLNGKAVEVPQYDFKINSRLVNLNLYLESQRSPHIT